MRFYDWISNRVSGIAPEAIVRHMGQMLRWAGLPHEAKSWLGSVLFFAWLCAVIVFLGLWIVIGVTNVLVLFAVSTSMLVFVFFVFYFMLFMRVEDRRKRVEQVLPDALHMVAANIRAGMSPVIALRAASRPEFGPLEEEIRVATAKALGTESFGGALMEMGTRIRSEVLDRTVSLFTTSMRSGGNLAALLENSANEILEAHELRRELIAGTNMYMVFIIFTMIIGMPLLLSISIQFVGTVESLQMKGVGGTFTKELGVAVKPPVSANFMEQVALVSLLATAIFASMLVGVIHDGSEWYGLRLAPLFAIASLLVFFLLRSYVLKALLGAG